MASGCTGGGTSKCFTVTSDMCVLYTGPAIPALNICQNDSL